MGMSYAEQLAVSFLDELEKIGHSKKEAAELTEAARDKIAPKNFALSAKQSDTGAPKYPIEDKAHAANALARVKQHGTPAEKSEVYKDVAAKFPELAHRSSVEAVREKTATLAKDRLRRLYERRIPEEDRVPGHYEQWQESLIPKEAAARPK